MLDAGICSKGQPMPALYNKLMTSKKNLDHRKSTVKRSRVQACNLNRYALKCYILKKPDENENEESQTQILLCVLSATGERDDGTQVAN